MGRSPALVAAPADSQLSDPQRAEKQDAPGGARTTSSESESPQGPDGANQTPGTERAPKHMERI